MSEFTDGVLFLKRDVEKVKQATSTLTQPFLIKELNEKWVAIFPENNNVSNPKHLEWLKQTSRQSPLLYFQHGGDHGWGYKLFSEGVIKASVDVFYELQFDMALDLGEARFPTYASDIVQALVIDRPQIFDKLMDEVKGSAEYKTALESQYKDKNIAAFTIFNISKDVIPELDKVVSVGTYEKFHEPVAQFIELLGFPEMEWISYHYLTNARDEDLDYEDE